MWLVTFVKFDFFVFKYVSSAVSPKFWKSKKWSSIFFFFFIFHVAKSKKSGEPPKLPMSMDPGLSLPLCYPLFEQIT